MHGKGEDIDDRVDDSCKGSSDHSSKDFGEGLCDPLRDLLDRFYDGLDHLLEESGNFLKELLKPAGAFAFKKAALFPGE